ncbi:MAG TPA: HAD hydrolase family protein [Amycolatopsis sp.]|nr:HAD hydrolase family protein [Amycolatopsis sp.]
MAHSHGDKPLSDGSRLVVADLLLDLDGITDRLAERAGARDALDTFLLAAAAVQVVEDHLQRDTFALRRAAAYLRERTAAGVGPAAVAGLGTATEAVKALRAKERRALPWRLAAAALRDTAALAVVSADAAADPGTWLPAATRLRDSLPELGRDLTTAVLRIPSCFRSFDQDPADLVALARRFRERYPDRTRPVAVLGVRTSGSYLAPLVGAALRVDGFREVHAETMRPGYRMRPALRSLMRRIAQHNGRVTIVDDPPETGQSIAEVADAVDRTEAGAGAVTVLLPLFGETPPPALAPYDAVTLPYRDWAVHTRLEPEAVGRSLSTLIGEPIRGITPVPEGGVLGGREHARAVFDVDFPDGRTRRIVAAGAGLGFFGRHAEAVAQALPEHLPRTYGVHDGIVFREWLADDKRLDTAGTGDAPLLATYVRDRAAALPADTDHAVRLAGRQPVWEAASRVLERNYGRAGIVLRPMLLDRLARRLCAVAEPSVVDGATDLRNWFHDGTGLSKVDADVRDFANTDLACYDPVYDLAGIDPGSADPAFVAALRRELPSDPERFLIYELVHLWDWVREGRAVHRAGARAVQRYLAEVLATATRPPSHGAICALDIDGVLESDALGFPMATPTAVVALRALQRHGFRPVIATGRCAEEVRERCVAYGLAGGVAEYGSALVHGETVLDLVPDCGRDALDRLRYELKGHEGVAVDPDYRHIVRAYRAPHGTARRAVDPTTVEQVLAGLGEAATRIRVVVGEGQTDFVSTAVDKGAGLAELATRLGAGDVAFAIGDSAEDLPMLSAAAIAYAPGNADAAVRASGIPVLRRHYAAGLSEAVGLFLGHRPGSCAACRLPARGSRTRAMLALLDASRAGARGLPFAAARCVAHGVRMR